MLSDFLRYLGKQDLCRKNDRILIAVSGGIDSMVLLDLFYRGGYDLGIAHCNFQLRGKDAEDDESFVKQKARELSVPFYLKRFDTESYSSEHGISIQMAARDLRYEWFEKIRKEEKYDHLATAHHLNDDIETSLINLFRGTGLQGLTGIPVRQGHVIRPLLFAGKAQIEAYADTKKIAFREDRSNLELKYQRNLIRNRIIPLIEKINPGFISTMASNQERLADSLHVIGYWLKQHENQYLKKEGDHLYFDREFFHQVNSAVFLHEALKKWGFRYDQCRDILKRHHPGSGALYFSWTHVLNVDRDYLLLSPIREDDDITGHWPEEKSELETGFGSFRKEIVGKEAVKEIRSAASPQVQFFDLDALKFPLQIRSWRQGDWFIPLGMKGKKKLSDFMIDEKIPVNLKQRIPVLLSGDAIVWVVGYRIDDRFKIIPGSNQILKITFEPFHDQSI